VEKGGIDLEEGAVEGGALNVALLGGVGLEVADVEEAIEYIEGFLGLYAGPDKDFRADGAGGEIDCANNGGFAATELQEFHQPKIDATSVPNKSLD